VEVTVSLDEKVATITLEPGTPLDPARLRKAVKDADFPTRDIRAEITGEVSLGEAVANAEGETAAVPDLVLWVPNLELPFVLMHQPESAPTSQPTSQPTAKIDSPADRFAELKEAVADGKGRFTIIGQVSVRDEVSVGFSVESFEPVLEGE